MVVIGEPEATTQNGYSFGGGGNNADGGTYFR